SETETKRERGKQMSFLLTSDDAEKAIRMALPSINMMLGSRQAHPDPERVGLYIGVAVRPTLFMGYHVSRKECRANILHEHEIARETWQYPFDEIGRGKAYITWRTG